MDTNSNGVTASLPTISSEIDGIEYTIKNIGTKTMVIGSPGTTIDGSPVGLTGSLGSTWTLFADNDIWIILTSNDVEQFDLETHEKVISTFKINNIYDQDDLFSQSSWLDNLIKAIMSLFNWGNDSNSSTNTVIEQSSQAEYQPEQNYDYDNPIVIELDPCDLNDWDC